MLNSMLGLSVVWCEGNERNELENIELSILSLLSMEATR